LNENRKGVHWHPGCGGGSTAPGMATKSAESTACPVNGDSGTMRKLPPAHHRRHASGTLGFHPTGKLLGDVTTRPGTCETGRGAMR